MVRKFEMFWSDFDIVVEAVLLDEINPVHCEEFWNALPFEALFIHSMSAGQMFKVRTPFIASGGGEKVFLPNEPPGTIVTTPMSNQLLITYGHIAEPFRWPIIGRLTDNGLQKLRSITVRLRDAYFFTKEIFITTFRKKE
jgi:hypothetical protein